MFHLSVYNASVAAVTDSDITCSNDLVLGTRNNHLILTEQFNLIAAHGLGSLLSRLRFSNAQLVQDVIPHIWPLDVSATVPDLPAVNDLRDQPLKMPMNEEIVVQGTTTGAGPSDVSLALWLAPPNWTRNRPRGEGPYCIRGTCVVTAGSEGQWTIPQNISFERDARQGVYTVIGAEVVAAAATYFRIRFPDQPVSQGKQLRPGGIVQEAANLEPWNVQRAALGGLGEWGRFHTFTPPQLEVFDDTAGGTYEVRLHLVRVGEDRTLVNNTT